ncbi:MAG: hypothetical protein H6705_08555 [Myxococcales bacterium]|nr:hypothetical protein [Myxococcales bacterium]
MTPAAATGRAALQETLRAALPGATLRHLAPADVPPGFAALPPAARRARRRARRARSPPACARRRARRATRGAA